MEVRGEKNLLKSLTDNFVFPSEALLKISRSLSNRSIESVLAFSTSFLECLLLPLTFKKRRDTRYPEGYLVQLTHVDLGSSIEMR
jgi:hypothetical protein